MKKQLKWTISSICFCAAFVSRGQNITIVNQFNELINTRYMTASIRIDNDTVVSYQIDQGKLHLDSNRCDSIADIVIKGYKLQTYHNQYLPDQFRLLDTIRLNQPYVHSVRFPVFLLGNRMEMDTILKDQQWLSEWLAEYFPQATISMDIYNTDKLSLRDRRFIRKVKRTYCELIGFDPDAVKINYTGIPYSTGQQDLFNEGTVMSRSFIESQNTPWMRSQAENYAIAIHVIVNR